MEANLAIKEQSAKDAELTIKSMCIQLGMNMAVSIIVLICVSWMRPQHRLVYSPRPKTTVPTAKPTTIATATTQGVYNRFIWIKHVMTASDDVLIEKIGFDAVLFLRFIRILRQLIFAMTCIGLGLLVPINIFGTHSTGEWPPSPYDMNFMSVSGLNYNGGKLSPVPNSDWYWAPALATWVFTAMVIRYLHCGSHDYMVMRRQFWESTAYHLPSRSLFISNLPPTIVSDLDLRIWLETTGVIKYPTRQVLVGKENAKLIRLFERYKMAVYRLEDTLASYLKDGKKALAKRPTVRINTVFGCGGRKVDAIRYYSRLVCDLYNQIEQTPHQSDTAVNYGWISFAHISWAHEAGKALQQFMKRQSPETTVRVSPPANDIIWPNLVMDPKTRRIKRWLGSGYFVIFVCAWLVPVVALSAASNVVNLIRMIPEANYYIDKYWFVIGLLQAYVTPLAMALLFFFLPKLFRAIGRRQGFRTRSSLDRRILLMLYLFFVLNHIIVFTISSTLICIYGQLRQLVLDGLLGQEIIRDYIVHMVKNMTDASTFWINLVCVKAFGVSMELAQVVPLLTITLRKWLFRPSPRKLKAWGSLQYFDYPQNYNILLFFFTIALVYSATSPLVLPFAFIYFVAVTGLYRYMLMSIYVTRTETGGKLWPVLFQATLISTLLFQAITFVILMLKGGGAQAYIILPLPIITLIYQILYGRRMAHMGSFLTLDMEGSSDDLGLFPGTDPQPKIQNDLTRQYRDPALDYAQVVPIVLDDVKDLLLQVYPNHKIKSLQHTKPDGSTDATSSQDSKHPSHTHSVNKENVLHSELYSTNPYHDENRLELYDPESGQVFHLCAVSEDYFASPPPHAGNSQMTDRAPVGMVHGPQGIPVAIASNSGSPYYSQDMEPSAPPDTLLADNAPHHNPCEKAETSRSIVQPPQPYLLPPYVHSPSLLQLAPAAAAPPTSAPATAPAPIPTPEPAPCSSFPAESMAFVGHDGISSIPSPQPAPSSVSARRKKRHSWPE